VRVKRIRLLVEQEKKDNKVNYLKSYEVLHKGKLAN